MQRWKQLAGIIGVTMMGLSLIGAETPAPEVKKEASQNHPVVLLLAHEQNTIHYKLPQKVYDAFGKLGIEIAWHNTFSDITPAYLKQFNAVVLYYHHTAPNPDLPVVKNTIQCLQDYVKEGGGLWVTKDLYTMKGAGFWKALLGPLGAEMLQEQILESDVANTYRTKFTTIDFGWTDAIEKHPVTEGVSGLFYDISRFEPGEPGSLPIRADASWRVLVKAKPTASTFKPDPAEGVITKNTGPGTISASPPLIAVREYGKGRVVLWPSLVSFTIMDGYSVFMEEGVVMKGERQGKQSDGLTLCCNIVKWLAEPSQAIAGFGGYKQEKKQAVSLAKEPGFITVDWNKPIEFGPAFKNAYMGLIGARTGLSTGEGTPEEFIAAAREAGYQFICFCEDINAMSKENWDKLVEACNKGSSETFKAFPGVFYLDHTESAFVILGDIGYPPPNWADSENPKKKIKWNATIQMSAKRLPPIIMLPLKSNTRPARLYSSFYGYAVQVYEGEKLLVEDWDTYFMLQKEDLSLFPTAVHIVKKPAEVKDARKRGMQAFVRADSLDKLMESIDDYSNAHYRWFKPAFPSSGPEICALFAFNWGTSDLAIPGNDRFRLQMMARSEKGLAEVVLYDNSVPVRRFLLNGAKEFKKDIDDYHYCQHSYLIVVTDVEGGKAVSWNRETNVQEGWFLMCGDNMNDMGPWGKFGWDQGRIDMLGTEAKVWYRPPGTIWHFPIINWDAVRKPDGSPLKRFDSHASMKESVLVGRFGIFVDYALNRFYSQQGGPGISYPMPVVTNEYYDGRMSSRMFLRRPPGPDLTVVEYDLTLKQDLVCNDSPGLFLTRCGDWNPQEGMMDHFTYFTPGGECITQVPTEKSMPFYKEVEVKPGEFAGMFPMCTTVIALDEPVLAKFIRLPPNGPNGRASSFLKIGVGKKGETLKAGTRIQKRFATLSLPYAAEGVYHWLPEYWQYEISNILPMDICTKYGLRGNPAYKVESLVGSVENTRLALRLKADGYGFRAKIAQCHLPVPLPVFVAPLNPNWSAGIWYKGQNKLLVLEVPPRDEYNRNAHNEFVKERLETDAIIRIGFVDAATAYVQLDMETGDRDVFIGNLVTCDRKDFFLTFHRDLKTGKATVEVHNPTDKAATVTVKPGKGFDLLDDFAKACEVPAGSSVMVDIN